MYGTVVYDGSELVRALVFSSVARHMIHVPELGGGSGCSALWVPHPID
jgi:methylase of polypeptide subunit release factors